VADILSGKKSSLGMGIFRFVCDLGLVVGPVLLGWLSDVDGYSFSLIFNAIILFIAAMLFQFMAREHPAFLRRPAATK
jgi:MFS family permease